MKVVIIRHLKVDFVWSKRCTSKEFDSECDVYDSSPIKETVNIQLLSGYKRIYISELSRSRETAERLYPNGEYTKSGFMNYPPPTTSEGVSVMPPGGMNLQESCILQNRACPQCPYPIGSPLGILSLRCLLLR